MTARHRQLALFAVISLVIVVAGWFGLIAPQRSDAATAAAKAQQAQVQLDALNGSGGTTPHGPTKQPAIHTSDLYALDTALPSQADQPDLIFELDRVAKASGVELVSISPQAASASTSGYTVVPINLSLNGSYFEVTRFLHNLRMLVSEQKGHLTANGPLFSVTTVNLTPGTDANDATTTVVIAAYYYGVTAGATPPVSATSTDTTTTTGG